MPKKLFGYRFVIYFPVLLLVTIASIQINLVYSSNLSPWSGGGFGMFSTTDAGGSRHLHAYSVTSGIRRELDSDPKLKKDLEVLLTLPTDYNILKFSDQLANINIPDEGQKTLNIQIWKKSFNPETLEPSTFLLKYKEVPINE
jgi:hypothetical protein